MYLKNVEEQRAFFKDSVTRLDSYLTHLDPSLFMHGLPTTVNSGNTLLEAIQPIPQQAIMRAYKLSTDGPMSRLPSGTESATVSTSQKKSSKWESIIMRRWLLVR